MKKILHLKDHVLLRYSDIINKEEYSWFKELITSYDEITAELVDDLNQNKQNFMSNILPHLKNQAIEEWYLISDSPVRDLGKDQREKCQICHTNIRYVCNIKNKFNGNELKIGTTCAEFFGFSNNKSAQQLRREAKRLRLINKINEWIPGINNIIESWNNELKKFNVLIPTSLEKPYIDLYKKTKKIYEEYLNEEVGEECFKKIEEYLNKKKELYTKIETYNEENKENIFVPKMKEKRWLDKRGMYNVIKELKNDKMYTVKNLRKVKEPKFMMSLANKINNNIFKIINAKILQVDTSRYSYIYNFNSKSSIKLLVKHEKLLLEYGYLLFGQNPVNKLNKNNILKISKIIEEKSFDSAINELRQILRKSKYSIYYYDYDFNDIFIKEDSSYYKYTLNKLIKNTKHNIFEINNIERLKNYLNNNKKKKYTKKDIDELVGNR